MDSVVHSALEEVCAQGVSGLKLPNLWSKLGASLSAHGLHPCSAVKKALWTNLLNIPGLRFESQGVSYDPQDSSIQSFKDSEKLNLRIFAVEDLRNSYVGIYDIKASDAGISLHQRRTLDRLAIARTNGITQSELAKEFGIKGNNLFYILRNLEARGLIVRLSTILRKNSSIVNTNMLHLYCYAQHLGCQQRLEVIKEDKSVDGHENEESAPLKEDVHVTDYLPPLKAICDKLEEADGKVLLVLDIKRDLGYHGTAGHRAWRNICHRLKRARVVEEVLAKVNNKEVNCIRLLKKFSPKNFEPKTLRCGSGDLDIDEPEKLRKRGQINEQLVDLHIEHQIYNLIDAEGSKGLTITEVCKRLGLNRKWYYDRLIDMFRRFGMHLQAESRNRGKAYRVWTSRNFNPEAPNTLPIKPNKVFNDDIIENINFQENSTNTVQWEDPFASKSDDVRTTGENENVRTEPEISQGLPAVNECGEISNVASEINGIVPGAELQIVNPRKRRSYQEYPCLTLSALSTQREQRILEVLQDEKFMIKAELHRLLESLEKDKCTMMCRQTLRRILDKLEEEGLCKRTLVFVPVVSNCGHDRKMEVVLHPSVSIDSPEISGKIYERVRLFEMNIRAHGSSKSKMGQPIPLLNGIQRMQNIVKSDVQAKSQEAVRANNGFFLAKMVRVKLLHVFLWSYLSNLPCWNDGLSSGKHGFDQKNPHSTCIMFKLYVAIKAMPIELFLQIVGSPQNVEDMIEKSRSGLRLSDLSVQEYTHPLSTRANRRLSYTVSILHRLKLIRMISHECSKDAAEGLHTTALELKPYIEEPPAITVPPSSGSVPLDIRPQIRHDFFLSSKKAVEEYWKTLEYCYAAIDSKVAIHAFPGSAVHEVFLFRSWASAQVMTADQQAKLLKLIVNDDPNKKIPFKMCENIAEELNLTLEQVLRLYYDRQKCVTRLRGILCPEEEMQPLNSRHASSSRKRKRSSKGRWSKHVKVDFIDGQSSLPNISSDSDDQSIEDHLLKPPARQRKLSWTESADRQLVIEYARYHVALGPNHPRTDWSAIPNMTATPNACRRRMAFLNSNIPFRRAVMRLCNMLTERYANHLSKFQNNSSAGKLDKNAPGGHGEGCQDLESEDHWDDFNNENIKMALDDALRLKCPAKLDVPGNVFSDLYLDAGCHDTSGTKLVSSAIPRKEFQKCRESGDVSGGLLSYHFYYRKYIKHLQEGVDVTRQAYKSLAVSNAIELLKLIFLSTSMAPEVPNLLAETLRRYSEHDLFSAFSYLRDAKILVGGSGTRPLVLSQQFMYRLSSSPYPTDTGKRAAEFASWVHKKEKSLTEQGIDLPVDLECGDVICLCALLSSRELLMSPCLPDQGVGEAEDSRKSKRKHDTDAFPCNNNKAKKSKPLPDAKGEINSRREKGFPGIKLTLSRATISRVDAVELFKSRDICSAGFPFDEQNPALHNATCTYDRTKEVNFGRLVFTSDNSQWEAMTCYPENLVNLSANQEGESTFSPEIFRAVYSAIQKAGDQGLGMEDICMVMNMQEDKMPEIIVEVLEAFGRALKVNAYDSIRVVDSVYRSKYCLTSLAGHGLYLKENPSSNSKGINNEDHLILHPDNYKDDVANVPKDISMTANKVHRFTILNLPEEFVQLSTKIQNVDEIEACQLATVSPEKSNLGHSRFFRPILPWISGDGTMNEVVYQGLVRRVLGILMQNPGMLEVDIISQMSVLNPQSCRKMLELMILDNIIIVRKMHQATSCEPPAILGGLIGRSFKKSRLTFREHFFANPMNAATFL